MESLGLTPFRRLIDQVVPMARPHFMSIFPSIAVPVVLLGALMVLAQRGMMSILAAGDPTESMGVMMLFIGMSLAMAVVFLIAYAALTVAAADAVNGRSVNMARAWRSVLGIRALWTLLLVTVAGAVSAVMCAVPALVVWPLIALTLQVMAAEGLYGTQAIGRSASLAWWNGERRLGNSPFFRVAAMLFIGWMIQSAIGLMAQGPFLAVQQYFVLRDAAGGVVDPFATGPLWLQLTGQVLGSLATAASWFYWAFGFAILYHEIRRGREASDLRAAVEKMTGAVASTSASSPSKPLPPIPSAT